MYSKQLFYLLALTVMSLAVEERKVHRLVGGHLRIINPDSDDSELMTASASGSKEDKKKKPEDEERKTLSQQVADGKYGLIQKELFKKPPKRPGVLSYADNPEVPNDNISNLGGLTKNDIWLAENHLLVLRGGTYPPHDDKNDYSSAQLWPAIDDYKAPNRQVKLPAHPKVPPPFPVQLVEGGPLQILGTNSTRTLNGTEAALALPPPGGYEPGEGPYFAPPPPLVYTNQANATAGQAPFPIPAFPPGEYPVGSPFPPFPSLNGTLPPFFASLPPGAAILPPPGNSTDYDEDDPSIYYPPPYSFYYPKDNTSLVQPGPLVPGIILPPPPDFFAPLDNETTVAPTTTRKPARTRKPTTTRPPTQIYATTTPNPPTSVTRKKTTKKPTKVHPVYVTEINNELKPIITTKPPRVVTILPVRQSNRTYISRTQKPTKKSKVTILRPVHTPSTPDKGFVYNNEIPRKPFAQYGPPPTPPPNTVVSTTQVPLTLYYSTANVVESNSVTQVPEKFSIRLDKVTTKPTTRRPSQQYYFYEEPHSNSVTTQRPYFNIPKEYYVPAKPSTPQQPKQPPQYIYVTGRPYNTQKPKFRLVQQPHRDSFSVHIARLQKQIHQYYTTPKPNYRQNGHQAKPVYQYSFEAANYQQPDVYNSQEEEKFRPLPKYSVQIQQAIEVIPSEEPIYQNTPAPVYYPQNYQATTEKSVSYSRPNYDYDGAVPHKQYIQQVSTPRPIDQQYHVEVTPNPVYEGYYTKPDEGYFDDITKKYFTMFGKKIPGGTTPLPNIPPINPTTPTSIYRPRQQQYRQQKPISLEGDTIVNYVNPRPTPNPDAELVNINQHNQNYPQVTKYIPRPVDYIQQQPKPPARQEPEIIKAIPVEVPTEEDQGGSFISYQLPGDDGAHFYFLTPQLAQRRDQGAGYFYNTQPENPRIRRNGNKNAVER